MTLDRWECVRRVFEQATACPPEQRDALLTEVCRDDPELRAEVESLLAHDAQAPPDFLADSSANALPGLQAPLTTPEPDPSIGQRIGRYTLKSAIGSGGMGAVYLAEQDQPRRSVAIKVLRWGLTSSAALRRFEYESQILGRLHHPHIAQVYEAGTHDEPSAAGVVGRPYFVMEYVEGARTLLDYAQQQRLGMRQRLELFAQVCDAVHHGHQKGIIHRDLKPGNLLVDAAGQVKIIDFGVARSTDADLAMTTLRTGLGELIGTLQYMSPEQCDADPDALDTRSDVYALGVILYELLTGERPYDASGTIYHATRIIKEQAPRRPSSIDRKLRGDIETIVLKALEKDRDRRYASAVDLAQDIHRFLNRIPIEARPPTTWTRLQRWMGRHPALATTGVCLAIALAVVLGMGVTIWYADRRPWSLRPLWDSTGPNAVPRQIDLLSLGGKTLGTWDGSTSSITFVSGDLLQRPAEIGGGRLALLGFMGARYKYPDYPNSLVAFDVDRSLTQPVLDLRIKPGDPLPDRHGRGYTADQFGVCFAAVYDVFEDLPGPEIIAVYRESESTQSILRIYDLAGTCWYEVWDDGYPTSCWWMAGPRLLVFAGIRGEKTLGELGYGEVKELVSGASIGHRHPGVIYALRPQRRPSTHEYLHTTPGTGVADPVWYSTVRPVGAYTFLRVAPSRGEAVDRTVTVAADLRFEPDLWGGVFWKVDATGQLIPGSHRATAPYDEYTRKNPGCLPDAAEFRLEPYDQLTVTTGETH